MLPEPPIVIPPTLAQPPSALLQSKTPPPPPLSIVKGDDNLALDYDELLEDRFMLGSPEEIAEQIIAQNRMCGINHLVLQFHWVGIPHSLVLESMTRFAEEVRPLVEQGL